MAKKFIVTIVALIAMMALVLPGCPSEIPETDPQPIEVTVLTRTEDKRKEIGEYLATVLEDLGFEARIHYGTSSELSPIWTGDPAVEDWNAYTGGWVSTYISRDEADNIPFFYTDLGAVYMGPLWTAYGHDQVYYEEAEKLWNFDYSTMEERADLVEECLYGSMRDGPRMFVVNRDSFSPFRANINMAADASGGIYGSWLWGLTIHFEDEATGDPTPGGTVKIATTDILTNPWNPVSGTNWVYDMFPIRATGDMGHHPDTNTGLRWPGRIEKADVFVQTGLPVAVTNTDWCTLTFEDEIEVPADAWADWDAVNQEFIPAGSGVTAKRKSVSYYPEGTFDVSLHDGSTLSLADFLMYTILIFDRAKTESAIFDSSAVSEFDAFIKMFKGVKFITDEPGYDLVVEYYSDSFQLDAELAVTTMFPTYGQGPGMWHTLAMAIKGEAEGEMAFGQTKSTAGGEAVEWTSFISGDTLTALKAQLEGVIAGGSTYAPYKDFMAAQYTAHGLGDFGAEIAERYANLDAWVTEHNHFWVNSGPMYLDSVTTTPKSIVLKRHEAYPDDADKWVFIMGLEETGLGHNGAWVDQVNIEVENSDAAAISRLQSADIDVYAFGISDADLFATVQADPNLRSVSMVGTYNELTFNVVGPIHPETGKVNPFGLIEVREAMNWAIDREYIVGTIMGGLGTPRYTAFNPAFADALERFPDTLAAIRTMYAYDFSKADSAIEAAMLTIPGVTRVDGKYLYLAP